ncbi:hypothetical protein AB0C28_52385 [Nonomuraea sp. NPDC048892]|uniref:hypothetical protein n=2 Tax=unclassified Nonomuraea TaxID=2593643 RepID=UPI0033FCAF52
MAWAQQNPAEFAEAMESTEVDDVITDNGVNLSFLSDAVVREISSDLWAAMTSHADAINRHQDGHGAEIAGIPTAIYNFVKKFWKQIVAAAKKAGKWALYKAHLCTAGAADGLYRWSGGDVAHLAAYPKEALAVAITGCIKRL